MPKITSYGAIFRDWDGLLGAVARNASLLPAADPLRNAMEAVLAKAKDLKLQQEDLAGKRQATTQALQQLVDDGREVARKLRAHVVSTLGSRTELLKQFGIPTRRRKATKTNQPLPAVDTPAVVLQVAPVDPTQRGGSNA
jgi:hypothetical protein